MTCKYTIFLHSNAFFTPIFIYFFIAVFSIKSCKFAAIKTLRQMRFVNIHTHRPTGRHIEPSFSGIHPWNAARDGSDAGIGCLTADAVGEIGLDYACGVPRSIQERVFRQQLQTAAEMHKPVILHCVRAFEPMMKILDGYTLRAVIFHGFIGSEQQARSAVARGYYLSFGLRTFRSPKSLQALKAMPLSRLFLETDDDDISIEDIYHYAAEARATTVEELQAAILRNYELIFLQSNEQQLVGKD